MSNLPHEQKSYPKPPTTGTNLDLSGFDAVAKTEAEIISLEENYAACVAEGDRRNAGIFARLILQYKDHLAKQKLASGEMLERSELDAYSQSIVEGIELGLKNHGLPSRAFERDNPNTWESVLDSINLGIRERFRGKRFTKEEIVSELNSEPLKIEDKRAG
jgi:hypothetical protein